MMNQAASVPSPDGEPLRVLDIQAAEIGQHPDLIRDITDQRVNVVLVRGVFPAAAAERVVERVETGEGASVLTEVAPQFRIYSIGLALDTAMSLEQYLRAARVSVPECRNLFRDLPDYFTWMPELFTRFSGGRPVGLPSCRSEPYNPVTVRRLPEGGLIPPHCEYEQLNRPAYEHLKELIGTQPIISYYVTLRPPQSGGQAVISTLSWGEVPIAADGRSGSDTAGMMERYPSMSFLPGAGDLIMFDGGRLYHEVRKVGGAKPRWTIGGFMSESGDRERIWYWS
jgi:hypothetical protein